VGRIFVRAHATCAVAMPANQLSPAYDRIGAVCPASP
jgi:hypothetical protein